MKTTNTIIQDLFTQKILQIYKELTLRGALKFKTDYIKALGIPNSSFGMIELNQRNFKSDEDARENAKLRLQKIYGANPDFIDGLSEVMFTREPKVLVATASRDSVLFNFNSKKEKLQLAKELEDALDENKTLKARIEALEQQLKDMKSKL